LLTNATIPAQYAVLRVEALFGSAIGSIAGRNGLRTVPQQGMVRASLPSPAFVGGRPEGPL
jgi:hypothetical protein